MTGQEKPDPAELGRQSVEILYKLLAECTTPGHRLFAIAGLVTNVYTVLANALQSDTITKAQATEVVDWLGNLKSIIDDPPANFVEMLATFHAHLEAAKLREDLDDRFRPMADELQQYLHSIAFSPPAGTQSDPTQIATDLADLAAFVNEFKAETDRGAALVGAALIDNRLEQLLRAHFLDNVTADKLLSGNRPLATFSARVDSSYALGLITEVEYRECDLVRRIRNEFAHQLHGLTFESSEIANRCRELKAMPYERWGSPRQRFMNSVITLCLVLWHRPAHAAQFKAQERQWPWHLAFGTMKATR